MKNNLKVLTLFTTMMVCFMALTLAAFADAPIISGIDPVDVTTAVGYMPVLPPAVSVTYSDATTLVLAVTWDQADPRNFETAGTFTVEGTVEGTQIRAVANVTVTNNTADLDDISAESSPVNKSTLSNAIDIAEGIYNGAVEGDTVAQFPYGTKAVFLIAMEEAKAVLNNVDASTIEVDDAVTSLEAAITKFTNLIITNNTGDINHSGIVEIGDLGMISGGYGIKAGGADWNSMMQADINGDGEIGLYELSFIAKRIIGV